MRRPCLHRLVGIAVCSLFVIPSMAPKASAELFMSSIFGDSMVVQRNEPVHVWGWTLPNTDVTVRLGDRQSKGTANATGRFDVMLPEMPAGGPYEMVVTADETRTFRDVLVGEVWICSGQSNMAWPVGSADDADLEALAAKYPQIRIISVPQVGTQEPQRDFNGQWKSVTPETIKDFSAVGYFFGRQLHQTLDIPIGLIDNAWGGSAAEAWVPRDILAANEATKGLIDQWDARLENYDYDAEVAKWEERRQKWVDGGRKGSPPRRPRDQATGNQRPANIYHGVLEPTIGYTIRGAIWYQGESNASRAFQYRELFPLMIQTWREKFGQGDFPFYWVNLADFRAEVAEPSESDWAELREAQTLTQDRLPATGEAVIIDVGEGRDIHPRNKQTVAKRLARLALKDLYGYELTARSPRFNQMTIEGNQATLRFEHTGQGLYTFDVAEPIGFSIAGEDRVFVNAKAKLIDKTTIQVWSPDVQVPVAVRYAWADNPEVNVESREGLPLTPFRTDDWPGITQK